MYINKVDDLIDSVLDNFSEAILKDKFIPKILKEQNFVKYQKEINNLWSSYIDSIPRDEIEKIVKKTDSVNSIYDAIRKYIAIYTFLLIGYYYQYDNGIYLNNIIEFTKNQKVYPFKVEEFFNAVSNATIVDNYHIVKNILLWGEKKNAKMEGIRGLPNGDKTIEFLGQFDEDIIKASFLSGDDKTKSYNLIKTIIVISIYSAQDRQEFFKLLEMSENEDGEFMFLNVSMPIAQYVSYDSITSMLSKEDIDRGLGNKIWNYLKNLEKGAKSVELSEEENILELINTGIIVPIVDDFMLYHRENEKYEDHSAKEQIANNNKKKEDTKIRYIINKIDSASDLNSPNVQNDAKRMSEVKKLFAVPLRNRKAVLYNSFENYKIISKYINQGRRTVESNEYFNDLVGYTTYPYINFKDFKKHGVSITANRTITAVRQVSFEHHGDFKQHPRNRIQIRTFRRGTTMNIVGFLIPGTKKFYLCDRSGEVDSVRKNKKDSNGIKLVGNFFRNTILGSKSSPQSQYWFFNPTVDKTKIETHESKKRHNAEIKNILSSLYGNVKNEIYFKILDRLDKKGCVTVQEAEKIIQSIQRKSVRFTNDKQLMNDLEKYIYNEKLTIDNETYDENDDILYGLEGNVHELKENPVKIPKTKPRIVVNLENVDEKGEDQVIETVDGICQHNITWMNIMRKKRINHKEYMENIYNFITKYVRETSDKRYVCKSCGFELGISRYLNEGSFDNDTGRFISFGMPMEIPLEEIPEYSKFNRSIKIIDKLIEKIASIVNVSHMMGSFSNARWKRKSVVKDTIDLLGLNNKRLNHRFKERNAKADKLYNINRNVSNMFVFALDNSIFQFSSKDKDYYKPIKINNIVAYIIINILHDISDTQVQFLGLDDKGICTFSSFEKYHKMLFRDLRLLINNKGDTVKCTDYKIFCYILYLISCKLAKRGLWHFENVKSKTITDSVVPMMQNSIVNTVVDIMNSIMESSFENKAGYELEIYRYRFLDRINGLFKDHTLYKMLHDSFHGIKDDEDQSRGLRNDPVEAKYDGPMKFRDEYKWRKCQLGKIFMKQKKKMSEMIVLEDLNMLSNCEDGQFHEWNAKGGTFVCAISGERMDTLVANSKSNVTDSSENEKVRDNYVIRNLKELSKVFCPNGSRHQFRYDVKKDIHVCDRCSKTLESTYSKTELLEMQKNIRERQQKSIKRAKRKLDKNVQLENEYEQYTRKVVEKLENNMRKTISTTKTKGKFGYAMDFVKEMEKVIGNDKNVLKGSKLFSNTYIIDHNHLGYSLDKPIIVTDTDNKITFKKNHSYFKTDVIYYVNYKGRRVEVFYDAVSKVLLGHKEESKNYVNYEKGDVKLKINFSIYNKLILLGLPSRNIDINETYEDIVDKYDIISGTPEGKQMIYKNVTTEIIRERHDNFKKIMSDISQAVNMIMDDNEDEHNRRFEDGDENIVEETYFHDKIEKIIAKYIKKIGKMTTVDANGKHRFMKHWKAVANGTRINDMNNIDFSYPGGLIDSDQIVSYDEGGNAMLFYIIEQMKHLINYNSNKFIKINTVMFIIDFISYAYDLFNIDYIRDNKEMRRFMYVLNSSEYAKDIAETDTTETRGIYEEVYDPDEEEDEERKNIVQDTIEENEALDVDMERDIDGGIDYSDKMFDMDMDLSNVSSAVTVGGE